MRKEPPVSAFLDRRSKDVRVQAIVILELELSNVERQIFAADLVISLRHSALDERPEAFDPIGMDRADDVLALRVVYHLVWELRVKALG
jgi:hypothetical protein